MYFTHVFRPYVDSPLRPFDDVVAVFDDTAASDVVCAADALLLPTTSGKMRRLRITVAVVVG